MVSRALSAALIGFGDLNGADPRAGDGRVGLDCGVGRVMFMHRSHVKLQRCRSVEVAVPLRGDASGQPAACRFGVEEVAAYRRAFRRVADSNNPVQPDGSPAMFTDDARGSGPTAPTPQAEAPWYVRR
jgi:hypothetical protein